MILTESTLFDITLFFVGRSYRSYYETFFATQKLIHLGECPEAKSSLGPQTNTLDSCRFGGNGAVFKHFWDGESYCWWFRNPAITTWDANKPVVNDGINYQPQLVIAWFLNHQQYHVGSGSLFSRNDIRVISECFFPDMTLNKKSEEFPIGI